MYLNGVVFDVDFFRHLQTKPNRVNLVANSQNPLHATVLNVHCSYAFVIRLLFDRHHLLCRYI